MTGKCPHTQLTPVILGRDQEDLVRSQPGQIVLETLPGKNPSQKRAGGVAQGVGPDLKPQYHKKKKKKMGVCLAFCPLWPQNTFLLISAFLVTGITGMSHCVSPCFVSEIGSCYVAQTGLALMSLLLQLPECWDYRYELPCLAF
jgi:hypothetical protein